MGKIEENKCLQCNAPFNDCMRYKIVYGKYSQFNYFCSRNCYEVFIESKQIDSYKIFEVRRCPGFYDCQEIGNLRSICEKEIYIGDNIAYELESLFETHKEKLCEVWCEPSEVSIIKSHVKLYRFMEDSEKRASELNEKTLKLNQDMQKLTEDTLHHTKWMTYLTVAMLIVTIINLLILILVSCA